MSLVTLVEVALAVAVVFGIGVAATSALGGTETVADEPLPALPPVGERELTAQDVARVRLPLAARGYRMAEVDAVLDRLGLALAERDDELARLRTAPPAADRPAPDLRWPDPVQERQPYPEHEQEVKMAELTLSVEVGATPQQTFDALVDWDRQGEWMLGTTVQGTARDGRGVGGGISAFTGLGPLGFLDTMEITVWDSPRRVDVVHTGRVVKGTGSFVVEPMGTTRSRFVWSEQLILPLGPLGRAGWPLVKPVFGRGVQLSLNRFARWVPTR